MDNYSVMIVVIILYKEWPTQTTEYSPIYNNEADALSFAIKRCKYYDETGCLWIKPYLLKNDTRYKYLNVPEKQKRCCNCTIS